MRRRVTRKQHAGSNGSLPITTWGNWSAYPGALAWSASSTAPPPLANGGLYTSAQSTGSWASSPFPATQYAVAMESAKLSGNPDVFYQQRAADNNGASFTPFIARGGGGKHHGRRKSCRKSRKARKTRRRK